MNLRIRARMRAQVSPSSDRMSLTMPLRSNFSGSSIPDLRHLDPSVQKAFPQIVKNGIPGTGMAPFGQYVNDDQAKLIQKYVLKRAEDEKAGR